MGCLALGIVCVRTTLLPNALCSAEIGLAMETMATSGRSDRAAQQLTAASEIDPLNPEPWVLLMQLRAKPESGELAESAIDAGTEAILRNPESPMIYELLGNLYAAVEPPSDASRTGAVEMYREATKRYPHSASIRASLAIALHDAGRHDSAAKEAVQALRLNHLNQSAGHVDKVLLPERQKVLETIVEQAAPPVRKTNR